MDIPTAIAVPASPNAIAGPSSGPQVDKIRRRRGPFKRSRTGCGTCKRRGKKCDEVWDDRGACQRCVIGQFDCTGRTSGAARRAPSSAASAALDTSPPSLAPPHVTTGSAGSSAGMPSPSAPSSTGLGTSTIATSQSSTLPARTPASILDSSHNAAVLNTFQDVWSSFAFSDAPGTYGQPLFDWPNPTTAAAPSALLTTCADGSLAIDSTTLPVMEDVREDSMWNDLNSSFTAAPTGTAQTFNSESRVLFLSSDKPMRKGVSLAEIYARVVESWLVGIPSKTRDYARTRILALHDRNSAMRAVRYAVAAAYIFLFASDKQGKDGPPPKLVELACRGAGIINYESRDKSESSESDSDDDSSSEIASRKIRFYVDHVSTPFAADLESKKWTEDAVHELQQIFVNDQKQLSDLLWGVIDLQLVEFIRGGAAPSYNMLALGDRLVRGAFGETHPTITLAELRTPETFSLRLYALSDISRCIVRRGRRTMFNFWTDHKADMHDVSPSADEPWAMYLGLPDSIVILLAEIVNLCAEMHASTMSMTSIKAQAEELEAALRNWQPTPLSSKSQVDSAALVSRTIAGELWRLSALILLYQSVHRVGGLHPVIRRSQSEILSLLGSIVQLPNGDLWGFIALPAFLAACLSVSDNDRKRSMEFLARPGPEKVWLDNIALVEAVWAETDVSGRLVDWHDKMEREGMSVAFF